MGILDFFGRNPKQKEDASKNRILDNITPIGNNDRGPVSVFAPKAFSEVETIIDCLRTGKTAIVHLSGLKPETALRILDMLSGAVYALDGGVYEMEKNIFMFSPQGVEIY